MEAYPLAWPAGLPRDAFPEDARFRTTFGRARDQLMKEVRMLGAEGEIILSTNIPVRNDGLPYAKFAAPRDPGVAIYFKLNGKPRSFGCDHWRSVEDNVHALSLTISAMRGMERWGVSQMLERVFQGFTALPAPSSWRSIFSLGKDADLAAAEAAYKALAKKCHPDNGGTAERMVELNAAIAEARTELRT